MWIHYVNKLIVFILIFCFIDVMGQNHYVVQKRIKRLELINNEFCEILDSLVREERKCEEYHESKLLWSVYFAKYNKKDYKDIDIIYVTLFSRFNKKGKPMGYFEVNGDAFILFGEYIHPDFFIKTNESKTFKTINFALPYLEDHATWIYGYKKRKIFKVKAYPCVGRINTK